MSAAQPKNGYLYGHITLGYLWDIISYNKRTGLFKWKWRENLPKRCIHAIRAGKPAGKIMSNGHRYIGIDGKLYLASRLAYFYVTGFWPQEIDHKNRNPSDNRWNNLRAATRSSNMANTKRYASNTSGYKGVDFRKDKKKWRASTTIDGKTKFIGYFNSAQEAHTAYCRVVKERHKEFARTE